MGIDAHEIHRLPSAESLGFIRGDIFSIEPRAEFDFITLLDVIEHIEHDQKFLDGMTVSELTAETVIEIKEATS